MDTLVWFTVFLIGVAVILMLVVAGLLPTGAYVVRRRFFCPWKDREVVVRYLSPDGRHPASVLSCTAFADPTAVACGAPCLDHGRPVEQAPESTHATGGD